MSGVGYLSGDERFELVDLDFGLVPMISRDRSHLAVLVFAVDSTLADGAGGVVGYLVEVSLEDGHVDRVVVPGQPARDADEAERAWVDTLKIGEHKWIAMAREIAKRPGDGFYVEEVWNMVEQPAAPPTVAGTIKEIDADGRVLVDFGKKDKP